MFLYHGNELKAVVEGRWKLHLKPQRGEYENPREFPLLIDLEADPDESYNLASRHPERVERMQRRIAEFDQAMRPHYVDPARVGR